MNPSFYQSFSLGLFLIIGFFLLHIQSSSLVYAEEKVQIKEDKYRLIDTKLEKIFSILDRKDYEFQTRFYKQVKEIFGEKKILIKNEKILDLIVYIEGEIDTKYQQYTKVNTYNQAIGTQKEIKNEKTDINNQESEKTRVKNRKTVNIQYSFLKHQTLILKFSKGGSHSTIIEAHRQKISQVESVFIFKKIQDISQTDMKFISQKLIEINPDILIFIDQEGGWINRYLEFPTTQSVNDYFDLSKDLFLTSRYSQLTQTEILRIKNLFPKYAGYYPSLEKIGRAYDSFSVEKQTIFLEIMAYIRLKTLSNNSINTYGLVADLNRGNIVIGGNARSFSQHVSKYKKLIDAFVLASEKTGVLVYLKHFPGHGTGGVDTHKGVLSLIGKEAYLKDNLDVFEYFITHKGYGVRTSKGLMIGHMYIPNSVKERFYEIINATDFLLTDDLGMQGYKLATGKDKPGVFFTTDEIYNSEKLIIVDTIHAHTVK